MFGAVEKALHVLLAFLCVGLVERDGVKVERLAVGQHCPGVAFMN